MAVELPKAGEIKRVMLELFLANQSEVTDILPGTPEHDLFEVYAEQTEGIFRKLAEVQDDFFIETATATALDNRATDFGLTRNVALAATGEVLFTGSPSTVIAAGTRVRRPAVEGSAAVIYVTDVEAKIPAAGSTVLVPATAEEVGIIGNTAATTITEFVSGAPAGITAVTNPEAFDSGRDRESDEELRQRIQDFFTSLTRGTIASIEIAALNVNGVFRAVFQENTPSAGRGILLLDTGSSTATDELRNAVKEIVLGDGSGENQGYLPAGTKIEVNALDSAAFDAAIAPVVSDPNLQLFNLPIYIDEAA